MRKVLIVLVLVFAVLAVVFLLSWGWTTDSTEQASWWLKPNWYTVGFAISLVVVVIFLIGLKVMRTGRGLPLEYLPAGLYPNSSIVRELKGKHSSEKEGELLMFVGSKRSSVPRYAIMPKSDFVKIDPEGNTLKVVKKPGHTMGGQGVNVRQLAFFKQGK